MTSLVISRENQIELFKKGLETIISKYSLLWHNIMVLLFDASGLSQLVG